METSGQREERVLSAAAAEPYKAVVFGSTGAVGKEVVRALAESDKCGSVMAIVRRLTQVSEWRVGDNDENSKFSKVEVKRINHDTLETSLPEDQMRGKQVVFYCLGTTRKDAGSAAVFRKVDLEYLQNACKLCRVAGVDHFSLVSSQGASASSPLLYPKTKGQGEKSDDADASPTDTRDLQSTSNTNNTNANSNTIMRPSKSGRLYSVPCFSSRSDDRPSARVSNCPTDAELAVVTEAGYPHTSIWRPGLLGRGDRARGVEKMARFIMTPMPVETLARAMVKDAESKLGAEPEAEAATFNNKDMRRLAALS